MRNLIPIVLWLVFSFFAFNWVQDKKTDCGCQKSKLSENITPAPIKAAKKAGPILYNWSKANPITNARFSAYKDSILRSLGNNKVLEITGLYRKNETNGTSYDNLGLARAHDAKKLFEDKLGEKRFRLTSKEVADGIKSGDDPFRSALFRSIVFNESIKEIDGEKLIYHPYNQAQKHSNAQIDAYLKDVADRVKKSGESITLIGHTDSDGADQANYNLGLRRAEGIKQILVRLGVPSNKVSAKSMGDKNPLASNATDSGKQKKSKNRIRNQLTI